MNLLSAGHFYFSSITETTSVTFDPAKGRKRFALLYTFTPKKVEHLNYNVASMRRTFAPDLTMKSQINEFHV